MDGLIQQVISQGGDMKAVRSHGQSEMKTKDAVIHFEEGLIGFAECKDFFLIEKENLAPFHLLQSVDYPQVAFFVIEATRLVDNYCYHVPTREWEAIGATDTAKQSAFAIVVIGSTPEKSTVNLQAPLLVNYDRRIGKQLILTDSVFSARHPLV
jgi:flagellar assembly factor FliW